MDCGDESEQLGWLGRLCWALSIGSGVSEVVPAAQPLLEGEVAFTAALSAAISAAFNGCINIVTGAQVLWTWCMAAKGWVQWV